MVSQERTEWQNQSMPFRWHSGSSTTSPAMLNLDPQVAEILRWPAREFKFQHPGAHG